MSWDFDFDSPKRKITTATQFIASADTSEDEDSGPAFIGPTQFIQNCPTQREVEDRPLSPIYPTNSNFRTNQNSSDDEDCIGPTQFSPQAQPKIGFESPIRRSGNSKKRSKPSDFFPDLSTSPVYESKRSRLISRIQKQDSGDGLTQKIDSCSSTQSPPPVIQREESTHISTPTSSNSSLANNTQPDFTSFRETTRKRRRKPKKDGLVEKLQFALQKEASNQRLNSHLPAKLRKDSGLKKSGRVLEVYKTFSKVTLKCLEHILDSKSGERKEFQVLVDKNLQVTKGCDVKIEGPWHSFRDKEIQVFSQVSKISVIQNCQENEYELQSEIIYRPKCSFL